MPRHNRIERRAGARVAVVIDSIEHTLTETGFIELMKQGLDVMQALSAQQRRAELQPDPERGPAERGGAVVVASTERRGRGGRPSVSAQLRQRRAALKAAAADYTGFEVASLRFQLAPDGSTRCRATFEDGGRARFTVRVPLAAVTAADIEDFESLE